MSTTIIDFDEDECQSYFSNEGADLALCFDYHEFSMDGVLVKSDGLPLLKDEVKGAYFLPDLLKPILARLVSEAKSQSLAEISITPPQGFGSERYSFCEGYPFRYSALDYNFIPGLRRPFNTGFLTPVFFNMDVLNKYSQNPQYRLDIFSSTYGSIEKGTEWNIQFGVNKEKKVIMWLGDIAALPQSEIYYLLSENVDSDHDIHSEFYNAQIDVKWSAPSIETRTFRLRKTISDLVLKIYGVPLNMLEGEVSNVIENLGKPIFWEDKHVSPVVEALNRIFVESINVKELKTVIRNQNRNAVFDKKGSLKIVTEWFGETLGINNSASIMCPFYVLYDFRVMVCHLQSDDTKDGQREKINERLGLSLENESYENIYDALFVSLERSLIAISDFFASTLSANSSDTSL